MRLLAFSLLILLLLVAVRKKWLSGSGALSAFLLGGILVFLEGWEFLVYLSFFFVTSSLLSHFGEARKELLLRDRVEKGGARDYAQVFANGGIPVLAAFLYYHYRATGWFFASIGSLSAAMADTWGTEIGLLSRSAPRAIFSWRRVPPGKSGGITPLGLFGSALGALLLGACVSALHGWRFAPAGVCIAAGMAGSLCDSLIGETMQREARCAVCRKETEAARHCGEKTRRQRGVSFLNNDAVNLLCTVCGAALGAMFHPGL